MRATSRVLEIEGLDIAEHGEEGYHNEPFGGSRAGVEVSTPIGQPVLNPAKAKPALG